MREREEKPTRVCQLNTSASPIRSTPPPSADYLHYYNCQQDIHGVPDVPGARATAPVAAPVGGAAAGAVAAHSGTVFAAPPVDSGAACSDPLQGASSADGDTSRTDCPPPAATWADVRNP